MFRNLEPYAKRTIIVVALAAAYRLIFVAVFPLGPDESFYWEWAQRLDFGYVEHPPLVAYAIALMTSIFGDTVWAARLLAVPAAALSSWFLYQTGRTLYDGRVGFWAATFHAVCPMFSMAGGGMLLPESLLTVWMTLALYLSARLLISGDRRWFYALGLVLGMALLSKYPGILILAALGLFAICSRPHRHWFTSKEPYVMVLIALLLFSPVIVWNIEHHAAGLAFVVQRTEPEGVNHGIGLAWRSFVAQAGYHSPLLYLLLWYGVVVAGWRAFTRTDRRALLLFCYSGPVIVVFLVVSGVRHTLPHWPAAGYLAAYVAAPAALLWRPRARADAPKQCRPKLLIAAAFIGAVESALMPVLLVYPLTTVAYHRLQPVLKLPEEVVEPMAEATGWNDVVRDRIVELRQRIIDESGETPVVLTHNHMLAGLLGYGLRDTCEVVSLHAQARQYDVWYDDDDVIGKTVIYVSAENSDAFRGRPEEFYVFAACVPEPPLPIIIHDVTINTVHLWVCTGYAGAAPGPRAMAH